MLKSLLSNGKMKKVKDIKGAVGGDSKNSSPPGGTNKVKKNKVLERIKSDTRKQFKVPEERETAKNILKEGLGGTSALVKTFGAQSYN